MYENLLSRIDKARAKFEAELAEIFNANAAHEKSAQIGILQRGKAVTSKKGFKYNGTHWTQRRGGKGKLRRALEKGLKTRTADA